jgi:hypothetical protein
MGAWPNFDSPSCGILNWPGNLRSLKTLKSEKQTWSVEMDTVTDGTGLFVVNNVCYNM